MSVLVGDTRGSQVTLLVSSACTSLHRVSRLLLSPLLPSALLPLLSTETISLPISLGPTLLPLLSSRLSCFSSSLLHSGPEREEREDPGEALCCP